MKPTFLLVGAAKAGSTSLFNLLGTHPDVFATSPKELHFFSFDEVYAKGSQWYESWIAGGASYRHRGEGSQSYTIRKLFPDTARRIFEYVPDVKLIYIVRNPLERIESLWIQLRCQDPRYPGGVLKSRSDILVDRSFNTAVRKQADALVESTNYWQEINAYREYFSDDQIKVVFFEEFKQNQEQVLRDCCGFLGVDPAAFESGDARHLNASTDHSYPGTLMTLLKATPQRRELYRRAVKAIPQPVRAAISRRFLRTAVVERPVWETTTRDWVIDTLNDDIETFLEFYGRPPDYWRLAAASDRADVTNSA